MTITGPSEATGLVVGERLLGRFDVLAELGSGGFGRVLHCRDRDTGEQIALKELHRFDADALLQFKREFRALSDVQHPNLVRFGELLEGEGHWALTLEYIPGTDVLSWVRKGANDPGFDEGRLRSALAQLVHGLMAIHALGMLHRDVKPPNVRVTPQGRVVLLDFGLVMHLAQPRHTSDGTAMGTVAYMAPEQAHEVLGPSVDWYALGVLLYELLSGRLPFDGSPFNIMLSKQRELPPPPSSLLKGVPPDLDALCMGLLATQPACRLDGEAVLAALSASAGTSLPPPTFRTRGEEHFVGRGPELSALHERFRESQFGGMQLALLEGESGIGKSALMEQFVAELSIRDRSVLVLRGRCHAAEQLGYKAFDGAVDELSKFLKLLSTDACRALLPNDAHLLPVLFPVLSRVASVAREQTISKVERVERYPLFAAFTELLARVGRARALVLAVDDLQWADEASLVMLKMLLESTRMPRLLMVGTVRPLDGLEDAVGEGLRTLAEHERVSRHAVGPLGVPETRALAARLCGDGEDGRVTRLVASESGGHPLFVSELARHSESYAAGAAAVIDLDAAILRRVADLPTAARLALELLCVASGPLPQLVLRSALGVSADAAQPVLAALRAQKLARTARRGEIVSYHDRMREAVLAAIDPRTLAAHHRKLALAWEAQAAVEPARVAQHWLGCSQYERAAPWLEQAASKAEQGGAFERAVEHYRRLLALEVIEGDAARRHGLKLRLSEALAGAGRCAESARELLDALEGAIGREAADLAIRAAQRLLQAGKVDEGLDAARRAFELLDMPWPATRVRLLMRLLYTRGLVAVKGFDVPAAKPGSVSVEEHAELDALKRLVVPLAWADFLRAAEIVARHTRLALGTGDPEHLAYALSSEACLRAIQEAPKAEVDTLFGKASSWQKKSGSAELEAHASYMQATAATFVGELGLAESKLEAAHQLYRTECPSAVWELTNVRGLLLNIDFQHGRFARHAERAQAWIDEAVARGDAFARATYVVTGFGCHRHLVPDRPAAALAEISDAMIPWRSESVGAQHFSEVFAATWVFAYEASQSEAAYWEQRWPRLSSSFLFRMPFMRETLLSARLLTAIASATKGGDVARIGAACAPLAKGLRSPRSLAGRSFGALMLAQLAWLAGQRAETVRLSALARDAFLKIGSWFARPSELLLARAEGKADAVELEQSLLASFAEAGWVSPENALHWCLPVGRTWR